jgi:hypothetical protein
MTAYLVNYAASIKRACCGRGPAMGYELHITRAQVDWDDDDRNPITAEEWLNFVANDDTLTVIENDSYEYIRTDWTPAENPNEGCTFAWAHGRISIKYPPKPAFLKMLQLAEQLGGRVLGDDGELYKIADDHDPFAQYPRLNQ